MLKKYFYLNTIGCQMNVYDSEQIAARLVTLGYQQTGMLEVADLVIVNTCTIRAKAEQKAFSFLGRLARLKIKKPSLIIGVGGCVAQQEGEKILRRIPYIDLVFGTQAIDRLGVLIPKIEDKRCRIVDVALTEKPDSSDIIPDRLIDDPVSAYVTIMRGCDNMCSFCVVPFTRGRERSRALPIARASRGFRAVSASPRSRHCSRRSFRRTRAVAPGEVQRRSRSRSRRRAA